jgi:hypothetical protein
VSALSVNVDDRVRLVVALDVAEDDAFLVDSQRLSDEHNSDFVRLRCRQHRNLLLEERGARERRFGREERCMSSGDADLDSGSI